MTTYISARHRDCYFAARLNSADIWTLNHAIWIIVSLAMMMKGKIFGIVNIHYVPHENASHYFYNTCVGED